MRKLLILAGFLLMFGTCEEGTTPEEPSLTGYFGVGFVAGLVPETPESTKADLDFGIKGGALTFYRCVFYTDTVEFYVEDSATAMLYSGSDTINLLHSSGGVYLPETLNFEVAPGSEWTLYISIGERERSINVTVPGDFTIDVPDTVSLSDTITITWGTIENAVNIEVKAGDLDTFLTGDVTSLTVPVSMISDTTGYKPIMVFAINGPQIPVDGLEGYTPTIEELEELQDDILTGIFARFLGIYAKGTFTEIVE
ncbi:hypothetical protein DRQ18_05375 [bacterium]|nr:MAG: hypothetical protein DRQ18_05375 [bacterium]